MDESGGRMPYPRKMLVPRSALRSPKHLRGNNLHNVGIGARRLSLK